MKSRLTTYMNLGGRILVCTLLAVIVTAAGGAQSARAVSSTEARKAIEAGYIEWAKARMALDMNTIERILAPDFYFQLPDRKLTRQELSIECIPPRQHDLTPACSRSNPEATSGRHSYLRN